MLGWTYTKTALLDPTGSALPMVHQTLFSAPADYALELTNTLAYGFWVAPDVSNRTSLFDNVGGFPVNDRHVSLNGYYQWYPVNGDTAVIQVIMQANGVEIGNGFLAATDSVTQFTPFDIPITYLSDFSFPDSATILISSSTKPAKGPSRLVVDKLSFDGFYVSDGENISVGNEMPNGLKIYPNPANERVMIEMQNEIAAGDFIQLFNLNGQLLSDFYLQPNQNKVQLNTSELQAGVYLIQVKTTGQMRVGKVVVVK